MSDAASVRPTAASTGGLALAVLCAQQFIMAYDTVSMNVAISTIVVDLDTTLTGVQTAIAMYSLVMAAFMVIGAKLADRWGRRRIFLLGALTYARGLIPVLALIGLYAAIQQRASEVLGSLRTWMEKNSRAITVVLCSVFGAFFLLRGLWGA